MRLLTAVLWVRQPIVSSQCGLLGRHVVPLVMVVCTRDPELYQWKLQMGGRPALARFQKFGSAHDMIACPRLHETASSVNGGSGEPAASAVASVFEAATLCNMQRTGVSIAMKKTPKKRLRARGNATSHPTASGRVGKTGVDVPSDVELVEKEREDVGWR
mmetsp:Transcript_71942/g.168405  ORF Transcript_71942/g.168405 Transcript_71942/m.168405 type:complete len:160 (+) Transcript_71942:3583-4062(+)